jgi:hypothetical protein
MLYLYKYNAENMADSVEAFLLDLPALLEQAERHIHNDNMNIVEYLRRRLHDYYTALSIIVMHCIEQNICNEIVLMLREILHRLFASLERYNELCDFNFDGDDASEISSNLSFSEERTHEPGRPRINVSPDTLVDLYNLHNSWSIVSRQTGLSYRTLLRRRREYGLQVANTVGPRNTYTEIGEEQLCNAVRDILRTIPDAGETYVIGALRSRGIHIQRWRVRNAIQTVDPISRALRRTFAVVRRVYNVRCPNALW